MNNDITVNIGEGRKFNYRVGAIIIDSGEILMVRNSGASHYYTVGGRIQFGESAQEAVLREAFEETQINLEIDKIAYVHENFFTMRDSGELFHELCFFFLMKANSQLRKIKYDFFEEEYGRVSYHWLPLDKLNNFNLYPEFFKTELIKPSDNTKYFMTRDEITHRLM